VQLLVQGDDGDPAEGEQLRQQHQRQEPRDRQHERGTALDDGLDGGLRGEGGRPDGERRAGEQRGPARQERPSALGQRQLVRRPGRRA